MLWALVGTPLGFSRWPSIEARSFTARTRADYKAKAVRAHLDRHPRRFAWVDDDLTPGRPSKAIAELPLEHLLFSPNRYIGLTPEHVKRLLVFAAPAVVHHAHEH